MMWPPALCLVTLLGLGALFLSMTNAYSQAVYALLFGEVLGVGAGDIGADRGDQRTLHRHHGGAVPAAAAQFGVRPIWERPEACRAGAWSYGS